MGVGNFAGGGLATCGVELLRAIALKGFGGGGPEGEKPLFVCLFERDNDKVSTTYKYS